MSGWLRRGAAAAGLAGDRAELWVAGSLAWLVYLGWIPLLLVVAPPSGDDLAYFGVSLVTATTYPLNVIALAATAVAGFVLLCLLAGAAEMWLTAAIHHGRPGSAGTALGGLSVILVASVPAFAAAALVVLGIVQHAPSVYISPDVDTPAVVRLAATVLPQLAVFGAGVLLGQVVGGVALRAMIDEGRLGPARALREAGRLLGRRPARLAGVALVGWLKDLLLLAGMFALLRVLWQPTGEALQRGLFADVLTPLLLVGFVAIWLLLVIAAGALHAAISAWWLAELSAVGDVDGRLAVGDDV